MRPENVIWISAGILFLIITVAVSVYLSLQKQGDDDINLEAVNDSPEVLPEREDMRVKHDVKRSTLQDVWDAFHKSKASQHLDIILAYNSWREYDGETQTEDETQKGFWKFVVRACDMYLLQEIANDTPDGYTLTMHPFWEDVENNGDDEADAIFTDGTNSIYFYSIISGEGVYPRATPPEECHYDILKSGTIIDTKLTETSFKGHRVLKYDDSMKERFNQDEGYRPIVDFSDDIWV